MTEAAFFQDGDNFYWHGYLVLFLLWGHGIAVLVQILFAAVASY
jgi:hypothetical protein